MAERLEANFENRIYYFKLINRTTEQVVVEMYSTVYTFTKGEKGWENVSSNKMAMAKGLIDAVITTLDS